MGPEPGDCPAGTAVRTPQSGPGPTGPHGHGTAAPSPWRPDRAAPGRGGRLAPECFPHSRCRAWGRLSAGGRSVPHLEEGAEPLQALSPTPRPAQRGRSRPARKEPPAHRQAWAGPWEADAPHQSGRRGSRGRWARSRARKGRVVSFPPPAGGFGLAEGSTEGHRGHLDPEGGRPSPDCWQIVTQSGKQNLASP